MLETAEFKHLQEQERRNKKLMEQCWNELWNKRNVAFLDEHFASDMKYYSPRNTISGLEAYKKMYQAYAAAFSNTRIEIQEVIASHDKVISRVLFNCVHTGELNGIPASGNEIELQAVSIVKVHNGKIVEEWELFDELGMLLQLGMEMHMKEAVD